MIFWRLDVTLSWWISWFITMKGVEMIHIFSKTWWEGLWATDDAGISLVFNTSTSFANTLLSDVMSGMISGDGPFHHHQLI